MILKKFNNFKLINSPSELDKLYLMLNEKLEDIDNLQRFQVNLADFGLTTTNYKKLYSFDSAGPPMRLLAAKYLYNPINKSNFKTVNLDYPMLNWTEKHNNPIIQMLIDEGKLDESLVYNLPNSRKLSDDKVLFHKTFYNSPFIPKTVFDINDVNQLQFPIIAKVSSGHSAMGVMKYDEPRELWSERKEVLDKYVIYCEAIKIKTEYRIIFFREKPVFFSIRIPNDSKSLFLAGKGPKTDKLASERLSFTYEIHDPNDFYTLINFKQLNIIHKAIMDNSSLDVYSMDIALDVNDKWWIIEINSKPATVANVMCLLYKEIWEDHYKQKMSSDTQKMLDVLGLKLIIDTLKFKGYKYSQDFMIKMYDWGKINLF